MKGKNPIQQLLSTTGKGRTEPSGVRGFWAAFYRGILDDINMNHMWWEALMTDWLSDYRKGAGDQPRKKITSMRGNLIKELGKPEMTWKVFYKGIRFLQPIKVELALRIHWRSKNRVTEHTHTIDFGKREDLASLLEELKEGDDSREDDNENKDTDE